MWNAENSRISENVPERPPNRGESDEFGLIGASIDVEINRSAIAYRFLFNLIEVVGLI